MSLSDGLDVIGELLLNGEQGKSKESGRIETTVVIFLVLGVIGSVLELPFLIRLVQLSKLIGLALGLGLLTGILLIFMLIKLKVVESFALRQLLLMLFTTYLWTVVGMSYLNRTGTTNSTSTEYCLVLSKPQGAASRKITIQRSTGVYSIQAPDELANRARQGDTLKLEQTVGNLGLAYISNYTLIEHKAYH